MKQEEIESLEQTALECRRDIVRMVHHAGSGHPAGSLSAIDVLVVLYMKYMRVRTNEPHWHGRDMFFLSKGHCTPAYYAAMSARGFFPREELMTFRDMHTRLQGHPSNLHLDCVDASSGSLGQGLSVANGAALAAKHDGMDSRYYVMLGDGEIQEGQVWEAAMSAAAFGLDNVCAILDYNKIQLDGPVNEVLSIGDVRAKWEASAGTPSKSMGTISQRLMLLSKVQCGLRGSRASLLPTRSKVRVCPSWKTPLSSTASLRRMKNLHKLWRN